MAFPQTVRWINEIKTRLVEMSGFLVPSGVILMWSGTADNIPKGWLLCDGTNGTPNLRDRFIIGAGGKYSPGATGGAASVTPEVTAGTAKTGISLANACPSGTAGSAKTGISIQNASVAITTGVAATGIGIQGTTLDVNTLPNHNHSITTCADNGSSTSYPMGPGDTQRTLDECDRQQFSTWSRCFRSRPYTLGKRGTARTRCNRSGAYAHGYDRSTLS